jgi:hypothetical protein
MPETTLATQNVLGWASSVRTVALYQFVGEWGLEDLTGYPGGVQELVPDSVYARQSVTFGPVVDGVRQSTNVLTFNIYANASVSWYGLLDANKQILAILPHSLSSDNSPKICMFMDRTTYWIDAPDHNLVAGERIVFSQGPTVVHNTYFTVPFDSVNLGLTTTNYGSLPSDITFGYGPFRIWFVHDVQPHRFRLRLNEYNTIPHVYFRDGWGYYQRIATSPFPTAGTLTIASIRLAEHG